MIGRVLLLATVLLLACLPVGAATAHHATTALPQFAYNETTLLSNGVGIDYSGYSESTVTNGSLGVTAVLPNGTDSAFYYNANSYQNNSGGQYSWVSSGSFWFSPETRLYVNGTTDNQTGYTNPYVWFFMNRSLPVGATFYILNTGLTVDSTSYDYALGTAAGTYVKTIFAEGSGAYEWNNSFEDLNATYTWQAYFDPTTGYIIAYVYTEQDTTNNGSGDGFTYTDTLAVTQTSYPLTRATSSSEPPSAPTGLAVTSVTSGAVTLSWTNPAVPLTNDTVYYSTGPAGPFTAVSVGVVTSATVSGLSSGTQYYVEVAAWNASGESPRSNEVSPTTSASSGSSSGSGTDWALIVVALVIVVVIVVVIVLAVSRSRRRHPIPKHSGTGQVSFAAPPVGPPPPGINLTPSGQPAVQQIIIKETVKVNCRYCGSLIDSTATACPFCGATRS
jgi:hypothetical protein